MSEADETVPERRLFSAFEEHNAFLDMQNNFLSVNLLQEPSLPEKDAEHAAYQKLSNIVRRQAIPKFADF
jgi:hypothetical protein